MKICAPYMTEVIARAKLSHLRTIISLLMFHLLSKIKATDQQADCSKQKTHLKSALNDQIYDRSPENT